MTEPRRPFRALLPSTLCSLFFFVCFLFGAVAADPLAAGRTFGEALLRSAGARVELFRAVDGTGRRAFALGPPSAERPVVLLHGLGADATYWTFTARALAARGRSVILLDGPGSGGSEAPRSPEGYGLRARVAGVEAMAQALGLDRFDLVGHSLGGWTAAAYAIESPHRVARLVLVDAGGFDEIHPEETEAEKARLVPSDRTSSRRLLDLLFFQKPIPAAGFILDAIGRNYGSGGPAATTASFGEEDLLTGREDRLPRGTVLIWGEKETLFPLTEARRVAGRIPGGRLLVITNVGHDGPLEAPKVFRQAIFSALGMPP